MLLIMSASLLLSECVSIEEPAKVGSLNKKNTTKKNDPFDTCQRILLLSVIADHNSVLLSAEVKALKGSRYQKPLQKSS